MILDNLKLRSERQGEDAQFIKALYVKKNNNNILNLILYLTGSQCNEDKTGEM